MKRHNLLFYMLLVFLFTACKSQERESYWGSGKVERLDGKPLNLLSSGYANMVSEVQIHLSKNNDTITFSYPYEKKIRVSELKSISNCRLQSAELLDSIYDIDFESNQLLLKFYFNGRSEKDRYVLTLPGMSKEEYLTEVQKLKLAKNQLFDMLKPVNASALDLSVPNPQYFSADLNLNTLNPLQVAEMLCSRDDGLQAGAQTFSFTVKNGGGFKYKEYFINNSEKAGFSAAAIGKINFNNLKFLSNAKTNKTEGIILSQKNLNKDEIRYLFNVIGSKMNNAKIDESSLPSLLAISWMDASKVIKLVIADESDESTQSTDQKKSKAVREALEQHISLMKKSNVTITIVANELSRLIQAEDFTGVKPSVVYNY